MPGGCDGHCESFRGRSNPSPRRDRHGRRTARRQPRRSVTPVFLAMTKCLSSKRLHVCRASRMGTRIHRCDRIRSSLHPESASRRIARSVRSSDICPPRSPAARSPRRSRCVTGRMNPSTRHGAGGLGMRSTKPKRLSHGCSRIPKCRPTNRVQQRCCPLRSLATEVAPTEDIALRSSAHEGVSGVASVSDSPRRSIPFGSAGRGGL